MGRRVTRITPDRVDSLLPPCGSCLFWQASPVRRARAGTHAAEEKSAWLSALIADHGAVGVMAYVDGTVAGHLLWAPPALVPGAAAYATAPASTDAMLLLGAYVVPEHRGGGLAKMMVQTMAAELVKQGDYAAVEAFATRGVAGGCVLGEGFLGAVGFKVHRDHPAFPRMRMDLRGTLTWRDVRERLPRLVPRRSPAVEGKTSRNANEAEITGSRPRSGASALSR